MAANKSPGTATSAIADVLQEGQEIMVRKHEAGGEG
jgi:hypothetical protein